MIKIYNYFLREIIIEMILKKLLSKNAIKITNKAKSIVHFKKISKQYVLVNDKSKKIFTSPYHVQPFTQDSETNRK